MKAVYTGPIIDCDVHYGRVNDDELRDYLPRRWQEFIWRADGAKVPLVPPYPDFGGAGKRLDAFPEGGGPPGSDYELMCSQLLDAFPIERALLTFDVGYEAALTNPELAEAVVRALNDWSIERWLEGRHDDRLVGVCLVPLHTPERGAAELRRVGGHPRIAAAFLAHNSLGKPFGHEIYHPVYEAAAELGLPLQLHVSGNEYFGAVAPWQAGGLSASRYDNSTVAHQSTAMHVTSLIAHGVFEKHPNLTIVIAESGVAWLPWLAASLDAQYDQLRAESIWVKRWPSEYLREHVALTTQPIETTPGDDRLIEHLSSFEGIEDMLCFSSDYPHWDMDIAPYLASIIPEGWHDRFFHENARRHLRLHEG
jgi:predicted TIM-barrel fold metal-dependent hydrolase